jgi:enterochelin esterase-like enzyme
MVRASVLRLGEMPGAPMREPPTRQGTTRIDTVPGHASWPDQRVFIRTPPDFQANSRRPLLVLMDGDAYLQLMHIDSVLDDLHVSLGERAPVVALVPADPAGRSVQYDCNPGWSGYLAGSLVPWIEQRYGTSRDPGDRVLGGYSLGGLAAACAATMHPEVFGNVLAQSGSFYRGAPGGEPEALARKISSLPLLPVRWSHSIGQLETSAIPSSDPSMLTASRHLRDVLTAKGYALHHHEIFGGHEQVAWAALLPDALAVLLRR